MGSTAHQTDIVVIGAGVVGLAVARLLAGKKKLVLIEKNRKFGEETSSRNSEVIHSGIYYPSHSKKTQYCLRGKQLLYEFCSKYEVPVLKCGKWVVATHIEEENYLSQLFSHASSLEVPCEHISSSILKSREPDITAKSALFFSETGVIDSHRFMKTLEALALSQGAILAYEHKFKSCIPKDGGWCLEYEMPDGTLGSLECQRVINCTGLAAAEMANLVLKTNRFVHRFCRGRYLNVGSSFRGRFSSLIYPVPDLDGLGIHVTRDLSGVMRLGPDTDWCDIAEYRDLRSSYDCDWERVKTLFLKAVNRYCSSITLTDLSPGFIGVRPKLWVDGVPFRDFWIGNHLGWIDLLGIESPGLTASLALAEAVSLII